MNRLTILLFLGCLTLWLFPAHSELVEYLATYKMHIGEKTTKIEFTSLIPQTIEQVQKIHAIKFSRPTTSVFESNGNKYATFLIDKEKGDITIGVCVLVEIFNHDYTTVKKGKTVSFGLPDTYLTAEKYIEKDDSLVRSWKPYFVRKDTLKTLRNIYNFVIQTMKYDGYNPGQKGAAKALEDLTGDCTEFTDLFVAFCRSCNIPSIAAYGYTTDYSTTPKHSWAEVYCPPYGWIRLDPTPGNKNTFNRLDNRYIQLSTVRNDDNLNGHFFYKCTYWGDPVKVVEDITLKTITE